MITGVLSKVDSPNSSPLNGVLRKRVVPPYTAATVVRYYWRFEDEPTAPFQYLGQSNVGFDFQVSMEGSGRTIRISQIGVSAAGVASQTDPRKGVQTTILIPSAIDNIVIYDGEIVFYDGEIVTYG